MKLTLYFLTMMTVCGSALAQSRPTIKQLDLNVGVGSYSGSLSAGYFHGWQFGKRHRMGIGTGIRYTGFLGADQYYITAPAKLTSESRSPLIFFKENVEENIDSLLIKSPQTHSVNLLINLDYRFSERLVVGFSIDVIGVTFGKRVRGNYINGYQGSNVGAEPTVFNVLLISDNDRGSLNSEFYGKYFLNDHWGIKAGAQFLFTEYTTDTKVQQLPEPNDRFRNKALLLIAGVTYKL